jgi:hypothetical protein
MLRRRGATLILAGLIAVAATATLATGVASAPAGAATPSPQCTFNSSSLPIVTGASAGEKIAVSCTGLPPLHPYLFMETSLILGIDPKAAPLFNGQIVSLAGLNALLATLPEINPSALTFPVSDLNGDLDFFYTLPTSQAPDPNAVCGPTTAEINDGLIGCALATIDLTSFKPVGAGSAVVEYAGDPLFPPNPTVALSAAQAHRGQTVSVGDAPGATTHWWLATLLALEGLLGGGSSPAPTVTVSLTSTKGVTTTAANSIHVSPAVYNNPVLTPPKISGTFTVPATKIRGVQTVKVTYTALLLGFPLSNSASTFLKVGR